MIILGIESSCDETAVALVKDGIKIISNIVSSSVELHNKTGGIIPEIAAREQIKCMIPILSAALGRPSFETVDAIAVTHGPGLIGSLLVGVETAKTIAFVTGKPIIPVNHVIAHIYANFLGSDLKRTKGLSPSLPEFPAIALVVSGGHTELFLMESTTHLKWLGGTRDDAAGEAFDKTARLLGLGYPGGPIIAAEAAKFPISKSPASPAGRQFPIKIKLPRPMMNEDNFDFSFSGLKTAVIREVHRLKKMGQWDNGTISQLAYELQESITDVLVKKTLYAAEKNNVHTIILGGGVAANKRLTEKFNSQLLTHSPRFGEAGNFQLFVPPPSLCTDNAAAIASCAFFHNNPLPWNEIQAHPDLTVEV